MIISVRLSRVDRFLNAFAQACFGKGIVEEVHGGAAAGYLHVERTDATTHDTYGNGTLALLWSEARARSCPCGMGSTPPKKPSSSTFIKKGGGRTDTHLAPGTTNSRENRTADYLLLN